MIGKEKPFFQIEWQNISFYDMNIELTNDLPSYEFYKNFYKLLFKKYSKFEELPNDWLLQKKKSAENFEKFLMKEKSILSYGCGLGYVEHLLNKKQYKLNVFDFSLISTKWLINQNKNITILNEISDTYDIIYLQQVLYAMNYSDCIKIIKKLKNNLNENGKIIISHTSLNPLENGINFKNFIKFLKYFIKSIYKNTINENGQFCGWMRDNKSYISIVKDSKMKVSKIFIPTNGSEESYIIMKK